jgi:hypothetical protein
MTVAQFITSTKNFILFSFRKIIFTFLINMLFMIHKLDQYAEFSFLNYDRNFFSKYFLKKYIKLKTQSPTTEANTASTNSPILH